jgi:ferredoxin
VWGDETCVETCPEIFEMEGDVAVAKMEEVPEELEGKCKIDVNLLTPGASVEQ